MDKDFIANQIKFYMDMAKNYGASISLYRELAKNDASWNKCLEEAEANYEKIKEHLVEFILEAN